MAHQLYSTVQQMSPGASPPHALEYFQGLGHHSFGSGRSSLVTLMLAIKHLLVHNVTTCWNDTVTLVTGRPLLQALLQMPVQQ